MSKQLIKIYDKQFAHAPNSFGCGDLKDIVPSYFEWYRGSNIIGDICVITECSIHLVNSIKEKHKILLILESPQSNPDIYQRARNPDFYNMFDYILTFSQALIDLNPDKFKSYVFGGCWLYPAQWNIYEKSKNISIIASGKRDLEGHKLRHTVINIFRQQLDGIYGNGYQFVQSKLEALKDFRYSIVIENDNCNGTMASEKINDCFMSGTIPIYWGCPKIGNYYDNNGILKFENIEQLTDILNTVLSTPEILYDSKIEAIKNNFEIAKKYLVPEDNIWLEFFNPIFLNT